jgi:TnsA endonuclease N terminal/TnsA endonuclease C terminal
VRGLTTGRVHHLLSQLETTYWYALDWAPSVVDIREQFPLLPIEDTLRIAERLCYRHPRHPQTRRPIVMTTDFLVTIRLHGQEHDEARAVELSKERICEKLDIERWYWQERGIDWGLVTEQELSSTLARNLALIAPYWDIQDRLPLAPDQVAQVATVLRRLVTSCHGSLVSLATQGDRQCGYAPGTCLTIAYHLLARKQWVVDLLQPLHSDRPVLPHSVVDNSDFSPSHPLA